MGFYTIHALCECAEWLSANTLISIAMAGALMLAVWRARRRPVSGD